jgi:hypothetical protein
MKLMTLSELESELPGQSSQKRLERLRNFSKEGVIPVYGEKSPGTGKRRLYSDEAVQVCAIVELMSEIGMAPTSNADLIRLMTKDADLLCALNEIVIAKRELTVRSLLKPPPKPKKDHHHGNEQTRFA